LDNLKTLNNKVENNSKLLEKLVPEKQFSFNNENLFDDYSFNDYNEVPPSPTSNPPVMSPINTPPFIGSLQEVLSLQPSQNLNSTSSVPPPSSNHATSPPPPSQNLDPATSFLPQSESLNPATSLPPTSENLNTATTFLPPSQNLYPATSFLPQSESLNPATSPPPTSENLNPATSFHPPSQNLYPATSFHPPPQSLNFPPSSDPEYLHYLHFTIYQQASSFRPCRYHKHKARTLTRCTGKALQ
jgi:hypothetical protein